VRKPPSCKGRSKKSQCADVFFWDENKLWDIKLDRVYYNTDGDAVVNSSFLFGNSELLSRLRTY